MIIVVICLAILIGTIYGSMLWEIRTLRKVVHAQENKITWLRAVLSMIAIEANLKLPPDEIGKSYE